MLTSTDPVLNSEAGAFKPAKRTGLTDQVTDRLRDAILAGELAKGERLSEVELAERLDVSRGPVREAMVRLRHEGLVRGDWHRGTFVTTINQRDAEELYSLRTVLEKLAFQRAIVGATADDLSRMRDIVDEIDMAAGRSDVAETLRLDVAFHDAIYQAAHHERLYQSWLGIRSHIALFLLRRQADDDRYLAIAATEHRELLEAIVAKRSTAGPTLVEAHTASAYERLRGRLKQEENALASGRTAS